MKKPAQPAPDPAPEPQESDGYFLRESILRMFGRSTQWLRDIKTQLPESAIRDNGKRGSHQRVWYHAPSIVGVMVLKASLKGGGQKNPEVLDAESREAIARAKKRELEVQRAEMEHQQRSRVLLPRADIHGFHVRVADSFRKLTERLERKRNLSGKAAARSINSVLEGYHRELQGVLEKNT